MPESWIQVELHEVAADSDYPIGDGDHGQIKPSMYRDKGIPYIRVSDMGWGNFKPDKLVFIDDATHKKNLKSELKPDDVLIAKTGATIGKCCIVPPQIKSANTTSSVGKVTLDKRLMSPKWLLYFFLSREFKDFMWSISERTAQPGFNIRDMVKFKVPLAPKAEHDRIVSKLNLVIEKIESNKLRLEKIPKILNRFRESVVLAGISGKLTTDWREKNKSIKLKGNFAEPAEVPFDIPTSWKWIQWVDIVSKDKHSFKRGPFGSALKKEFFVQSGYKVYEQCNPINDDCSLGNYYVTEEKFKELEAFKVASGDLLISCSGATLGRITQIPKEFKAGIINQALLKVKLNNDLIISSYFIKYFRSKIFQQFVFDNSQGSAQPNIKGVKELKVLPIPLPPHEEQKETLRRVERLFAFADNLEARYTKAKTMIDKLPQSILAKAFRGELIPQDPNDEPASVLLERIKKEKLEAIKKPAKKRKMYGANAELAIAAEPKVRYKKK